MEMDGMVDVRVPNRSVGRVHPRSDAPSP